MLVLIHLKSQLKVADDCKTIKIWHAKHIKVWDKRASHPTPVKASVTKHTRKALNTRTFFFSAGNRRKMLAREHNKASIDFLCHRCFRPKYKRRKKNPIQFKIPYNATHRTKKQCNSIVRWHSDWARESEKEKRVEKSVLHANAMKHALAVASECTRQSALIIRFNLTFSSFHVPHVNIADDNRSSDIVFARQSNIWKRTFTTLTIAILAPRNMKKVWSAYTHARARRRAQVGSKRVNWTYGCLMMWTHEAL